MPCLSVAVVDGDDIVFARGFGVRELGWGDKVAERLDGFVLSEPYRTGDLSLRDTLCHRAGYATWAGDLLWWGSDVTRDESVARLRFLEPAHPLRAQWGYSNFMFLVAGEVIEQASGEEWETVIESRLLAPLGMDRTTPRFSALSRSDNVATPHSMVDGEHVAIPHRDISNIAPAGSIYSSAADMARWLLARVHDGELGGQRVTSAATMAALRTPHTTLPGGHRPAHPLINRVYGLGVLIAAYRGEYLTMHGGGIDGMIYQVAALPDRDFGLVVMTNSDEWGGLADVVMYEALDRFLQPENRSWAYAGDEDARDWSESGLARTKAQHAAIAAAEANAVAAPLAHWHLDVFEADWDAPAARSSLIEFDIAADGSVKRLSFQVRPDFIDPLVYEFTRVPE